jgi:PAS domain S-box-containing protein
MAAFFQHQMDYIFFIYGLSFILLAVICRGLAGEAADGRPWRWLCLFGWLHGLSEWLDLLAFSLGDGPLFGAVRLGVMAASFMSLVEFGRRGLRRDRPRIGRILGPWLTPALVLLGVLGVFSGGMNGLDAAFRYSLGFPGALLAALAILRTPGHRGTVSRWGLRLAAAGLLVYAPATGLVVPAAAFPPADWLNHSAFFAAAGFPIQLLRAVCALGAMTGLWIHRQGVQPDDGRSAWVRWGVVATVFILVAGLGGFAVEWRSRGIEREERRELTRQATALARTLPAERIGDLTFTPADRGNPLFERMREVLGAYARYRDLRRICTLFRRDGGILRGPGTRPDHAPHRVAPGTPLPNPPPELQGVFESGHPATIGPRATPFGTFITALAPVVEPRSGRTVLVVSVDRFHHGVGSRTAVARLLTIGCILALLLALLGSISLYRRRDRQPDETQGRLRHLETAMAAVLGLALTAAAVFLVAEAEQRETKNGFDRLASARFERIRHEIFAIRKDVAALARFFEASRHVDRAEFNRFVGPVAGMDAVQAYEWIPVVPASEKERFEAAARKNGAPGFRIWRRPGPVDDVDGVDNVDKVDGVDPADPAEPAKPSVYYPVYYIEPLAGNETAPGFDLGSEPVRRKALETAARTGLPTATDPITLVQETEQQQAILIFHPVFEGEGGPLRGFALAVVRLGSLLERAAGAAATQDHLTEAGLVALSSDGPPRLLAVFSDQQRPSHPIDPNGDHLKQYDLLSIRPVFAFGRAYAVAVHPMPAFYSSGPFRTGGLIAGAGLLITALLTLFVGSLRNRQLSLDRRVRKQTRELEEGMRLLRTLIDGLPDIVALQKPDHTILFYNRAGYDFLGRAPEAVDGRRCFELIGRTRQCENCATSRAFRTGRIETSLRFVEGADRWIEARAIPVPNEQGELTMAIEILRDVTESKEAEAALRESMARAEKMAAEADRANAAKSEFLANMSHEIRTPMNGVLGMAGLMLDTELTPEQRQYAEVIQSSGETLLTLIDDILDFSKIEAGKLDLEELDFDLRSTLEDFADALAFRAHQKDVEFHCLVRPDVPDRLRGDPGRLRQILNNLAGNAVKFTREGEVSVIVERRHEAGDAEVVLRFSVYDTGIGISGEAQARLFTAFSQADGSTTRKFGGTGLGLAISKRLAGLMGGEIGLDSVEGEGSTFWFTARFGAPAAAEPEVRAPGREEKTALAGVRVTPDAAGEEGGRRGRILVVEDNITNQKVAMGMLRKLGCRADAAANGREALKALETLPYDLVLMDCQMPEMDGFEAAAAIRDPASTVRDPDLPVIALTAYAMKGDRERCLAAGMNDYLAKPITLPALAEMLDRWLQHHIESTLP